jgi:hypothetical protein
MVSRDSARGGGVGQQQVDPAVGALVAVFVRGDEHQIPWDSHAARQDRHVGRLPAAYAAALAARERRCQFTCRPKLCSSQGFVVRVGPVGPHVYRLAKPSDGLHRGRPSLDRGTPPLRLKNVRAMSHGSSFVLSGLTILELTVLACGMCKQPVSRVQHRFSVFESMTPLRVSARFPGRCPEQCVGFPPRTLFYPTNGVFAVGGRTSFQVGEFWRQVGRVLGHRPGQVEHCLHFRHGRSGDRRRRQSELDPVRRTRWVCQSPPW